MRGWPEQHVYGLRFQDPREREGWKAIELRDSFTTNSKDDLVNASVFHLKPKRPHLE